MKIHRALRARTGTSILIALVGILTLSIALAGLAESQPAPTEAPANPAFTAYLQGQLTEAPHVYTSGGYTLGLIPSPLDLSHLSAERALQVQTLTAFPASYDLRTTGKLTPIRDQGQCGSCWSFASYGSLESSLMPGESLNFSENNLKNMHGYDISCCDGGNAQMSAAYLARWAGAVPEASDPYNTSTCNSPSGLSPAKHVQEILYLPDRTGPLGNDVIKQAVTQYGAVYTSYYHSDTYYKPAYYAYYFNGSAQSNHAVCIVGWDDNFDKARFATQPPGNGAFIMRNSWGTWWGQSGYYYMSYYDANVGKDNTVFRAAEPATNYDHIYQYDTLGWVSGFGVGGNTGWSANVFTAAASENAAAVSFYTPALNSSYEVRIYVDPTNGPVNASGPATTQTGSFADAGYHTVVLNSPVPVISGHKFSAVVKLTTPSYNYPICMEYAIGGYTSAATASPGQSYYSSNGSSWSDMTNYMSTANVCVKAFTKAGAVAPPPIAISQVKAQTLGTAVSISQAAISAAFTDYFYIEAGNRACGIRVDKTAHGLTSGMAADVTGTLARNSDGELTIQATSAVQHGTATATVKPLITTNRSMGGSTSSGQPGIPGAQGLNNIGLLVIAWGRFTKTSPTTFTVDDGGLRPLKCMVPSGVSLDPGWRSVCVTGISSRETIGLDTHSLLRVESAGDIVTLD